MDQEEVWTFTVSMYGRDGVAKLCLDLQDRYGLDVNMLLFMLYLGQKGLAPHSISALEDAVRPWRDNVIIPLRQTRRFLKDQPGESAQELRQKVKADELHAERIEQHILCAAVQAVPSDDPLAAAHAYFSPNRFDLDQAECDRVFAGLTGLMKIA
ncbi:TIGR02444 family protein [Thalassospira australica]|uniref:TIGR02444 family protein n=1 Tax=Thalassospira australica TaxID=1528106 RepID=UPI00051A2514|nr:TIGR02444 family protein [Thalassospira australica]